MWYKKIIKISLFISSFMLLMQFSSQKNSVDGKEKPSVNVYGLLTDTSNHSYRVENITIAGRFNDIAVYQKPNNPDLNPDINTTKLDLCEISEIRIESPKVVQFNKRDYIEIIVISNDNRKTQNRYIIEKLKKVFCDEVNEAGPIEKEVSFLAVARLQIQGCKKQEESRCYKLQPQTVNQKEIDYTVTRTETLIKELQDKVDELPADDGSLKSQILQMLTELQSTFKKWFA